MVLEGRVGVGLDEKGLKIVVKHEVKSEELCGNMGT